MNLYAHGLTWVKFDGVPRHGDTPRTMCHCALVRDHGRTIVVRPRGVKSALLLPLPQSLHVMSARFR